MLTKLPKGELIVSLLVIAFSAVLILEAGKIPVSFMSTRVGPTIFPFAIAIFIGILGILLLFQTFKGGWQEMEEKEIALDYSALLFLTLGLTLNVVLITKGGFTLASIIMFVFIARAFGSRDYVKNTLIAMTFALIAYFGFVKLLKINIGSGIIENFLESLIK